MEAKKSRLLVLNFGHAAAHYFMLIYPTAVLTMGREFASAYDRLLSLATLGFFVFGLATLPAGWLGDRFSRRALIVTFFLGSGLAAILTGLATSTWQIAVGLALIGLFGSLFHPVGVALLVQETAGGGQALGVFGVSGNLGLAAAALITGVLCDTLGWRWAFFLPGLVVILLGVIYAFQTGKAVPLPPPARKKVELSTVPAPNLWRIFFVVMAMALFGGFIFTGLTVALPKIFEERLISLAGSTTSIGVFVSLITGLAALAQIFIGRMLDQNRPKAALLMVTSGQAVFILAGAWAMDWWMLLAAGPMMFAIFGQIPIGDWLVAHYATGQWHARIYAFKYVVGLGVSALAVPVVAWLHGSEGGFTKILILLSLTACLTLLSAFTLPRGLGK